MDGRSTDQSRSRRRRALPRPATGVLLSVPPAPRAVISPRRAFLRVLATLALAASQALAGVSWTPAPSSSGPYRCCCGSDCRCTGPCCNHAPARGRSAPRGHRMGNGAMEVAGGDTCRMPAAMFSPPPGGDRRPGVGRWERSFLPPPTLATPLQLTTPGVVAGPDPGSSAGPPRAPPAASSTTT